MTNIAILIYPKVEVLDFCGPFEVFRNAKLFLKDQEKVDVFTVAETLEPVDAQGLVVIPSYDFTSCPSIDILVIPGGNGNWLKDQNIYKNFLQEKFIEIDKLVTVCTGALLAATSQVIPDGIEVTTHQEAINALKELLPNNTIQSKVRFTHSDKIITSGGISAGIDSSLYTVSLVWNRELADKIAKYMEYHWTIDAPNIDDPALV